MPGPYGVAEGETGACWEVRGRGEFSHYNKRGEAGLSSTYLYSYIAYFLWYILSSSS